MGKSLNLKIKPRQELEAEARNIFNDLEEGYKPCEALFIVSKLTEMMSLAMLSRDGGI